ncbi:MAG TPA: hypothetical protein VK741_22885 [Acetobacteraceae bacterium]|nr:hypothetical protein [Acetobacteraceae bacterium]
MADTLQEFLVSVRYVVDGASQQSFLQGLTKAATSTKGLATELVGLTTAMIALSRSLAEVGEKFYWMSLRMGSSVQDIKATTFALSNLGISGEEATQGLERFSEWSARFGGAATAQLRSLGITATDTTDRYRQLGEWFRAHGGTYEFMHGTDAQRNQFAQTLAWAESFGFSMREMLAASSGDWERFLKIQKEVYEAVGLNAAAMERWKKNSYEVSNQFRAIGLEFRAMREAFSAALMERLGPILQHLYEVIKAHLPQITALLRAAAAAVAFLLGAMTGLVDIVGHVIDGFQQIFQLLTQVAPALDIVEGALIAFGVALMRSPIGAWITALSALMLILEDYAVWESGGISAINWSFVDKFKDWCVEVAGIKVNMWSIVAALGAIGVALAAGGVVGRLGRLLGLAAPAAAGAAGAGAGAGVIASTLAVGVAALITTWLQDELNKASDSIEDWAFGKGHSDQVKKLHEQGAKQFWGWLGFGSSDGATSGGGGTTTTTGNTVGDRNLNPGNLRPVGGGGFRHFESWESGVAAMVNQIQIDQTRHGQNTLMELIAGRVNPATGKREHGWAPVEDANDPSAYATRVAREVGIDKDAPIDTGNPALMAKIVTAMSRVELGHGLPPGVVDRGVQMALGGRPTMPATSVASAGDGDGGGGGVTIHQQTTIQVPPGTDGADTAHRVVLAQNRVNETLVRNTASVLR